MTLSEHSDYWRDVAAQERAKGNDRLAEDYDRMADVAEQACRLAHGDRSPCGEVAS